MNTKQVKKIRKQLGYKNVNVLGSVSDEQAKLKKQYKALKRSYKTPAQLKQQKFEEICASRRIKQDEIVRFEDSKFQAEKQARKEARLAKREIAFTKEQREASEARKAAHAQRQSELEASERSFRQNLNDEKKAEFEANEKIRKEKAAIRKEKLVLKKTAQTVVSDVAAK